MLACCDPSGLLPCCCPAAILLFCWSAETAANIRVSYLFQETFAVASARQYRQNADAALSCMKRILWSRQISALAMLTKGFSAKIWIFLQKTLPVFFFLWYNFNISSGEPALQASLAGGKKRIRLTSMPD